MGNTNKYEASVSNNTGISSKSGLFTDLRTAEKLENVQAACPFSGELEASVGSGEKCAAFSSHCGSPDIFEYKLRSCKTPSAPTVTYDGKLKKITIP